MFDVIILAGGLGTRLRSVIGHTPKSMAMVCGKPFLHYILTNLSLYKINRVILSLGYKSDVIIEWIKNERERYPFNIEWVIESEPLGTGGAIKKSLENAKTSTVCVLNGDTFFSVDLARLHIQHKISSAKISLAMKPMVNFDRYGTVQTDTNNVVTSFTEKGFCEKGNINGGVYFIQRNLPLISSMPEKFSFEKDLFEKSLQDRFLYGFSHDRYFIDIGVPEDYERAEREFLNYFR
ncbi:MAG TPA: nucleotidyltransferase family protein [Bacteroidaceae bacterium]|nr:nucleotidyltransferase family protein [Bacteroidaceae bacterium]